MRQRSSQRGFTLVELIIVMALLAIAAAVAAPSLSRSLRQRNLNDEAARLLALTEYCRDEAVSQGIPMTVWLTPNGQKFGVEPKAGFEGNEGRSRDFLLNPDVHFEFDRVATRSGVADTMEFEADGSPSTSCIDMVRLVDRFNSVIGVARTNDGWGYEIVKDLQR